MQGRPNCHFFDPWSRTLVFTRHQALYQLDLLQATIKVSNRSHIPLPVNKPAALTAGVELSSQHQNLTYILNKIIITK